MKSILNSLFIFTIILSIKLFAQEQKTIQVNEYLLLGPVETNIPAFTDNEKSVLKSNLEKDEVNISKWWPKAGAEVEINSTKLKWVNKNTHEVEFEKGRIGDFYYLAFYVKTDRFVKSKLEVSGEQYYKVVFNRENIIVNDSIDDECKGKQNSSEIKCENGKSLIIIKTLLAEENDCDWKISVSFSMDEKYINSFQITTNPIYFTNVSDLLDRKKISDVSISFDGKIAAAKLSQRNLKLDNDETWFELYNTIDGSRIESFKGIADLDQIDWSPVENKFAYITSQKDKSSIWVYDYDKKVSKEILSNIENLTGFEWAPDGEFMVYMINNPDKTDKSITKKHNYIKDRWPNGNDITHLYKLDISSGATRQITSGKELIGFECFSPDSKKMIISKTVYGVKERPFHRTDYFSVDLETFKVDSILSGYFTNAIYWMPDGKNLLLIAGPQFFGKIGVNTPEGVFPNDFDNQAYLYNIESKEVKAISKTFKPELQAAYFSSNKNNVYLLTTDSSYKHLYKYDLSQNNYELVNLGIEALRNIRFAETKDIAVFSGSSSNMQRKAFAVDFSTNKITELHVYDKNEFADIKLGEVKDYYFTNSSGVEILGRVYYPPGFDENKKYPAIVYYYGGVSPVTREFEGRYPKNIWTANGYLIYILQPRGCTGFGQKYSSKHVNDWGNIAGSDIIEGTKAFLKDHPFVDPERVGCMGASYGGFMTMNIITKTDIFAAAISHAGISALTGYWGEGYWGAWYNSVAAAESFPWNNKKVYVDYSPIYNADKITTPLLLTHGNTDPNVPLGESWNMYTALKLQGKDVELIEVEGMQHWITEYHKRIKWTKTIIAYFDKYLKGQPEWWDELYGK
ncbi:MAG: S9 family peptidase [Ignavibacteria bacterium]